AELEKTLRELTNRIRDESVRYHYNQEMRERVHAFFGSQRGGGRERSGNRGQGWKPGQGGQWSRGGGVAAARGAITESLGRSAMVRRVGEAISLREATIMVALVNHPLLIDENFEYVEFLDLANSDL